MKPNGSDGRTQKTDTNYDNGTFSTLKDKNQLAHQTNHSQQNKFKQIKRNISLFSFMSNNVGIKEASTQTDLTTADISRLEEIKFAHSSILYQMELKNKKPFEAFSLMNNELYYPLVEKDNFLKKKTLRNPLHLQSNTSGEQLSFSTKKKFRSKNSLKGDIKIFNSVVVNNNDPNINSKYYKNLIKSEASSVNTPYGKEIYSSKVINLYNTKTKNNESEDEQEEQSDNQSSEIGDMINQIRGCNDTKKKLLIKKDGPTDIKISNFTDIKEKMRIHKKPRKEIETKEKDTSREKSVLSAEDGRDRKSVV